MLKVKDGCWAIHELPLRKKLRVKDERREVKFLFK